MPLYQLTGDAIQPVARTSLAAAGLRERRDLQRLLKRHGEVLAPDLLVVAEEFGSWEESQRRIDLLALDRDAHLVVIELKRDQSSHMELQGAALRRDGVGHDLRQLVDTGRDFLEREGSDADAREELLAFLAPLEAEEPSLGDVRVILVAGEFGKELTTAVLWLNEKGLDLRCIRLQIYQQGATLLADVEQIIPLKEAQEYVIQLRKKREERERVARSGSEEDFWRELPAQHHAVARELMAWFESRGAYLWWGSGSCVPILRAGDGKYHLIRIRTDGQVVLYFFWISRKPPFDDRTLRLELRDRLEAVPGIEIPLEKLEGKPRFPLSALAKPEGMAKFHEAAGFWMERGREAGARDA